MNKRFLFVICALLASTLPATAQNLVAPFKPAEGTSAAAFYEANKEHIKNLGDQARSGTTTERLNALDALANAYPDAALSLATTLVKTEDEAVAQAAARLLAESIVMTDHSMQGGAMMPGMQNIMQRAEAVRKVLREVILDARHAVRDVAAASLASMSDKAALDKIDEGVKANIYSIVEAINYYGLARQNIGASYIAPYIDSENQSDGIAAISYLASNPQYQGIIADKVLLNKDANEKTRLKAADVLSRYDKNFTSYALVTTANPAENPELYGAIIKGYLDNATRNKSLTKERGEALNEALGSYLKTKPNLTPEVEGSLKSLKQQLQRFGD